MASLKLGITFLLSWFMLLRCSVGNLRRRLKCTGNDQRKTYPYCMFGVERKTLWCDQSAYSKLPSVQDINAYLHGEDCIAAKKIFINDSCITGINADDLRLYTDIEVFNGGQNYIASVKDLTFHGNPKLKELDLRENEITTLEERSLRGLHNLRVLHLSTNTISNIPPHLFKDLRNLEELSMENNFLAEIDNRTFKYQRVLKTLNLKGNMIGKIQDFSLVKNLQLQHLYLDGNEIEVITARTFSGLNKLKILTISHNRIKFWPQEYGLLFDHVHTLHLGNNQLKEFTPSHTAKMKSLQNLLLDCNFLSTIHEDLFMSTPRLTNLNLSANHLEDIPEGSFRSLCHLDSLTLAKNKLQTPRPGWFHHMVTRISAFTHIDISENPWTCDCDVRNYKKFHDSMKQREDVSANILAKKLEIRCQTPKFANALMLNRNLTAEVEIRLGCLPEPVAESIWQPKQTITNDCGTTLTFQREHFDMASQFVVRERQATLPQSSTARMKSKGANVNGALITVCVLFITATVLSLAYCSLRRKR